MTGSTEFVYCPGMASEPQAGPGVFATDEREL